MASDTEMLLPPGQHAPVRKEPLLIEDEQEYKAYLIELLGGPEAYEAAKRETITREELWAMLAHDTSNWSDTVRQLRDEGY